MESAIEIKFDWFIDCAESQPKPVQSGTMLCQLLFFYQHCGSLFLFHKINVCIYFKFFC